MLEGRRYPYEGSYRVIARTTTDADGKFAFKPELDRNHRLRVTAPAQSVTSKVLRAYMLPAFELSFRALRPGVVRLSQRYTVPKTVRLRAPTLFYLGPRGAKLASCARPPSSSAPPPAATARPPPWSCPAAGMAPSATRAASALPVAPAWAIRRRRCPRLKLAF